MATTAATAATAAASTTGEADVSEHLRSYCRTRLVRLLRGLGGDDTTTTLFMPADITGLINQITPPKVLKAEARVTRFTKIEAKHMGLTSLSPESNKVFLIRPDVRIVQTICDDINEVMDRNGADAIANTHLVLFPQRDLMCETIIEQEGLSGLVQLHVLSIDLIPLDKDFLSLCYKPFYADYHLNQIYTCIPWITQSIMRLEQMFGPIPISSDRCVYGAAARDVYELLKERRADPGYLEQLPPRSVFKSMFLFDRRRDLMSALGTQVTYEGLLDEVFGIDEGYVEVGPDIGCADGPVIRVLPADTLYAQVRDLNLSAVPTTFNAHTRLLGQARDDLQSSDIADMRAFVARLPALKTQHKSLVQHIYATDHIIKHTVETSLFKQLEIECQFAAGQTQDGLKFIQELIFRQTPLVRVLRLLCLYCASTGVGLEAERYNDLKRAFMHSYGFEHTLTFDHLATMGLFHSKSASKPTPQQAAKLYPSMRKDLSLVKPEDKEDDDPKYSFYYGFAPASAYSLSHSIPITPVGEEQPLILLYFIGGITAAEMSCLRLIGIQRRVRFVFATTSMINGKDLVQFALPDYTI